MERLKKIYCFLFYFFLTMAVSAPWFFKKGYLFFIDFYFGPQQQIDWHGNCAYFLYALKLLGILLTPAIAGKLFVSAAIFGVLLSGHKIAARFTDSPWVIAPFALFNPFIYDRFLYGQIWFVWAFAFLGLMFGYGLQYIESERRRYILLAAIFAGLCLQTAPQSIFFILPLSILLLSLVLTKKNVVLNLKTNLLVAILIILILNINFLSAIFSPGETNLTMPNVSEQDFMTFQTRGSVFDVMMLSGFWGKEQNRYVDLTDISKNWGQSFILLLPLIIWGAIKSRKNKKENEAPFYFTIGLLLIYCFSLALAIGVSSPWTKGIALWMFKYVPFYESMRESQKWIALLVIVYLVFLSIGAREFFKNKIISSNALAWKMIIVFIIVLQAPFLLWGFWGQIKPADFPQDWYFIDSYTAGISAKVTCEDKILFLPWHMYMGFSWVGRTVANPARDFFRCPVISGTNMEAGAIFDNSGNPIGQAIIKWMGEPLDSTFLADEKIRYIILAKETDWEKYGWLDTLPQLLLLKDSQTIKFYVVNER